MIIRKVAGEMNNLRLESPHSEHLKANTTGLVFFALGLHYCIILACIGCSLRLTSNGTEKHE